MTNFLVTGLTRRHKRLDGFVRRHKTGVDSAGVALQSG